MDKETLYQYIEGKLNQQQKDEIARWLDADDKNMQEYLLLRGVYDATLWNDEPTQEQASVQTRRKQFKLYREILKIAAVFILAVGLTYTLIPPRETMIQPETVMQTIYVPEGQRAEIFLVDGTKVWLNAKTSLTFPNQFTDGERRVTLSGEAYFDVVKDDSKHFVVSTNDYQVRVLGTEFNVKAYQRENSFETALLKGSVEVTSNRTHQTIFLQPHTYVYERDGKLMQEELQNEDHFLWKVGIIAFEAESVKDIFSKLELYFDVKIDVQNTRIIDFPYTGKFRTKDGIEHVLRVLQLRHKFTYTKDNETNTIVIK